MNVNIFLRQFKAKNKDIVANIANGDVEKFGGVERLKGLLKLMPEKQEVNEGSINVCTLSRGVGRAQFSLQHPLTQPLHIA